MPTPFGRLVFVRAIARPTRGHEVGELQRIRHTQAALVFDIFITEKKEKQGRVNFFRRTYTRAGHNEGRGSSLSLLHDWKMVDVPLARPPGGFCEAKHHAAVVAFTIPLLKHLSHEFLGPFWPRHCVLVVV